ncbi:MAG: hypothetical protein MUC96_24780 [Myxococcaceae bacterium]|nr:hypothetical protein [Myxococcaceae bacterium]
MKAFGCALWLLLLSASAMAQDRRPVVMPVPLEVAEGTPRLVDADRERLAREFRRLLKLAGTNAPDLALSELATTELSSRGCATDDACVAAFAKKAGALYAVFVRLERRRDGGIVASGRAVRDDGVLSRPATTVERPAGPFVEQARAALGDLLSALDVASLPAERVIERAVKVIVPSVTQPAAPAVTTTPASELPRGAALVIAGSTAFVAGLVTLTVTSLPALGVRGAGVPPRATSVEDATTLFRGYVGSIVGLGLMGLGAALGGLGAWLWATAPGPRVTASVWLLPGAAGATVGGAW